LLKDVAFHFETIFQVRVHLLDRDDTMVAAELLHYDKNYNLALFKVDMNLSAEVLRFRSELKFGQEVFLLGRDKDLYLNIDHGHVQYADSSQYERHHYMFLNCVLREVKFIITCYIIFLLVMILT